MALPKLLQQSVPQELYDEIYERTFGIARPDHKSSSTSTLPATSTSPPTITPYIVIDEDYTPPIQLQIDQKMRQDFRNTYYATTFIGYAPDMVSWFRSLSEHDRALVKSIQCWLVPEGSRARKSRGFLRGCELKDLGAKEVDYCLYKDCVSVDSYAKACMCANM